MYRYFTISCFCVLLIGFYGEAFAELKFGTTGQLHSSARVDENTTTLSLDRARVGFQARTPKGFFHLEADFTQLGEEPTHEDAHEPALIEAYSGLSFNSNWKGTFGLQAVAYGLGGKDDEKTLGYLGVNSEMELKESVGLAAHFEEDRWFWDTGIYAPAYRSLLISTSIMSIEDDDSALLTSMRLGYRVGQVLLVQGSFALQQYHRMESIQNDKDTRYLDVLVNIDWSPFWGMFVRYSSVDYIYGQVNNNHQTSRQIQADWLFNDWRFFIRSYQFFDDDRDGQLQLLIGTVYWMDKHNKLLINANVIENEPEYDGFWGESHQYFLLQHQFEF